MSCKPSSIVGGVLVAIAVGLGCAFGLRAYNLALRWTVTGAGALVGGSVAAFALHKIRRQPSKAAKSLDSRNILVVWIGSKEETTTHPVVQHILKKKGITSEPVHIDALNPALFINTPPNACIIFQSFAGSRQLEKIPSIERIDSVRAALTAFIPIHTQTVPPVDAWALVKMSVTVVLPVYYPQRPYDGPLPDQTTTDLDTAVERLGKIVGST